MQKTFSATVFIDLGSFVLEREIFFVSSNCRERFRNIAQERGWQVSGFNDVELHTAAMAIALCERDLAAANDEEGA